MAELGPGHNELEEAPPAEPGGTKIEDRNLSHLALVIIFGIAATTLTQPMFLSGLKLRYILKDEIHVTKSGMASFVFWCGLAWYLKPFAGILTDAFPIFGTRRRHYILFGSALACIGWLVMGGVPHTYSALLTGAIVLNVFIVMVSTVTGAFLVEAGQSMAATGRLTALRSVVQSVCGLANGPISGYLVKFGFLWMAGINAALALSIFPIVYFFLRERPIASKPSHEVFHNAGVQLKTIFTSGTLWMALLFIALFYFTPGFSTPLFFRQTDELHFKPQWIGNLGIFSNSFGILAALAYSVLIKRFSIRTMLLFGIITGGAFTLCYLFYTNWTNAVLIESQAGFFGTLGELALLDFAARAAPPGCEGLAYSLMLSVRNVALFGADILGSKLSDAHWSFSSLVYLNAGTTYIVLLVLPFLPAALMQGRDAPRKT